MTSSTYLYGDNYSVDTLKTLHYPQALLRKVIWAKETLDGLLLEPYANNNERINAICKAIKFNETLYDELYYPKELEWHEN